jgi:hypothetical protein
MFYIIKNLDMQIKKLFIFIKSNPLLQGKIVTATTVTAESTTANTVFSHELHLQENLMCSMSILQQIDTITINCSSFFLFQKPQEA